ncbi:MAG: PorT family protein [Tannerellaceae bacterium]|jgi:hypothetical protein|nr:PorT family protein [Tannerellaceae bacterium]
MNKDTDSFEHLFRTKLKNLEADTSPEDWEAIATRLTKTKRLAMWQRWRYAVAVILILLIAGGGWYWSNRVSELDFNVDKSHWEDTLNAQPNIDTREHIFTDDADEPTTSLETLSKHGNSIPSIKVASKQIEEKTNLSVNEDSRELATNIEPLPLPVADSHMGLLIADAAVAAVGFGNIKAKKVVRTAQKKWTFGTGIGGLNGGTTNLAQTYLLRSSSIEDRDLMMLNAPANFNAGITPQTKIDHKIPLSFGLSINRNINERWAISTGLVYTLLRSEWETEGEYSTKTKRYLHFAGVPLAITYKIAEWNKLSWYASAGGMGEFNFAGQEKASFYAGDDKPLQTRNTPVCMKELQWSLNARTGLNYPLMKYVGVFAEMGLSYHFDNGSKIETVYSRKPWNFSPQIGLRLGF